jgi:hypothetical protein
MELIHCPEMSVKDYHSMLRYTPEERSSHQHGSGSLKSFIVVFLIPSMHLKMGNDFLFQLPF